MHTPSRLERLERYLAQDPANAGLLGEAFEAALACGEQARARAHLATARQRGLGGPEWQFRQAQLAIAARELDEAAQLLAALDEHPAVVHDLGHVRLLQGDAATCCALVEPWVSRTDLAPEQDEALQVLWLRALHRTGQLQVAWDWARQEDATGRLQPRAYGVASLVAVDLDDFPGARAWSELALKADGGQFEALVARASVALAEGQAAQSAGLLQQALQRNPDDGRTWSALGMASMQAGDLALAQRQFELALRTMPGHIGTWHALGWTRLLQKDAPGAKLAFNQALALDRNVAETQGALGLVCAVAGDAEQAQQHLDMARRLDPQNVTGRYARALLAGEAGDLARLDALAQRLLDKPGFFEGKLSDLVRRAAGTVKP